MGICLLIVFVSPGAIKNGGLSLVLYGELEVLEDP
jgi:hypothetical protein